MSTSGENSESEQNGESGHNGRASEPQVTNRQQPTFSPNPTDGDDKEDGGSPKRSLSLSLAALGVVYGDIGTSPIYALRESFFGAHRVANNAPNIYGIVSLILWSLILLIAVKYMSVVMKADNNGEGGTVALLALLNPWRARKWSTHWLVLMLGLFGSAMLFAGFTITPALTVMSAVEGLTVATSVFQPYVVIITLVILVILFLIQKRGTANIGKLFGPILLLWFVFIAALGIHGIVQHPQILAAINPWYALEFFAHNGFAGFLVLSAVFLCLTGGEAMYADMGHFGLRPVRLAWYCVVLPAVLLNYFGQGALLLTQTAPSGQPFFDLAPSWALYPLIGFAAVAAVIASQAVISGAFSMTRQFVQLGQLPLFNVVQTSREEWGQIYVPGINWMLMLATLGLVIGFQSSSALAGAYGISVATTMWSTTILTFFLALRGYKGLRRNIYWFVPAMLIFFIADTAFFGANLFEIATGGWYPVAVAIAIFVVMTTWARGRSLLRQQLSEGAESMQIFGKRLEQDPPIRIPGTAVFLTGDKDMVPARVVNHLKRHGVLQEHVLFVTVEITDEPRIPATGRLEWAGFGPRVNRLVTRYGFMQQPNLPRALKLAVRLGVEAQGLTIDADNITYYVGRETLIPDGALAGMATWRDRLFSFLSRNARPATAYYDLPPDDVVELGFQVKI